MPLYDFECEACHQPFEAIVSHGILPACIQCASPRTKRQVSACKSYRIEGDNSGSSTPARFNHGESRRKESKLGRLSNYYKHGKF